MGQVFASFSQYQLLGGPPDDSPRGAPDLPGLAYRHGPSALVILTGLETGMVRITTEPLAEAPATVEQGWDVVGEIDVPAPDGSLLVADWAGPVHREMDNLAGHGPGLYRVRIHARDRRAVGPGESTETHRLAAWPASTRKPSELLVGLDDYGRAFVGQHEVVTWSAGGTDTAAVDGVEFFSALVGSDRPARLSGETVELAYTAVLDAPPSEVLDVVSAPWTWVGIGGQPQGFTVTVSPRRGLFAGGEMTAAGDGRVFYSWRWRDLRDTRRLPDPPMKLDIECVPYGSATRLGVTIKAVPVEWSAPTNAIWSWAMARLPELLRGRPGIPPWGR